MPCEVWPTVNGDRPRYLTRGASFTPHLKSAPLVHNSAGLDSEQLRISGTHAN